MEIISSILIGIIQGLLEWLPISSSGQISVILMKILDVDPTKAFQISLTLHIGTALTAAMVFRRQIFQGLKENLNEKTWRKPIFLTLLLSPLISIITGLPIFLIIRCYLRELNAEISTSIIGFFLIVTGLIQLVKNKSDNNRHALKEINSLNLKDTIILGLIQGFSVIPGISRSAVTISCLLALKYKGEDAITISFITSIPVSLAIGTYGLIENFSIESVIGILAAFIAGTLSINTMLVLSKKLRFPILLITLGFMMILQLAILPL